MGSPCYGNVFTLNVKRALAYLEVSAAANYKPALAELSSIKLFGKHGDIDIYKTQRYYQKAQNAPPVSPIDAKIYPPLYSPAYPRTYKILEEAGVFMKLVDAAFQTDGGAAAYEAGLFLKNHFNECAKPMGYLLKIAAASGHVEATLEYAKFI